jgi:hypothetical protein
VTDDLFVVTLTAVERGMIASLCLGLIESLFPEAFDESTLASVVAAMDQDQRRRAADACVALIQRLAEGAGDD